MSHLTQWEPHNHLSRARLLGSIQLSSVARNIYQIKFQPISYYYSLHVLMFQRNSLSVGQLSYLNIILSYLFLQENCTYKPLQCRTDLFDGLES